MIDFCSRLARVSQPVLLSTGAAVDPHSAGLPVDFFGAAADAAAAYVPDAHRLTIEVAGRVADPPVLGPHLSRFYTGWARRTSLDEDLAWARVTMVALHREPVLEVHEDIDVVHGTHVLSASSPTLLKRGLDRVRPLTH
ncbi:hypothetical protein [Streptomyces canus]|uniref:hypothetical protein n=1 Tax=Streptomyces canus TaxID=58343 RepID=UPI003819A11B